LNDKIPVLAVQPHYAELLTLYKDREVRHYPAPTKYIGKRIAIYASKTKPLQSDLDRINDVLAYNFYEDRITGKTRGAIVATATLYQSSLIGSYLQYQVLEDCHFAPLDYFVQGKTYFWKFSGKMVLDDPLPFELHGPIVWSSIEADKLAEYLDEAL
jgi:hypothetical protein